MPRMIIAWTSPLSIISRSTLRFMLTDTRMLLRKHCPSCSIPTPSPSSLCSKPKQLSIKSTWDLSSRSSKLCFRIRIFKLRSLHKRTLRRRPNALGAIICCYQHLGCCGSHVSAYSGHQFDVDGAILKALVGLKVDLAISSSLHLDDYGVSLSFTQKGVPAIVGFPV